MLKPTVKYAYTTNGRSEDKVCHTVCVRYLCKNKTNIHCGKKKISQDM